MRELFALEKDLLSLYDEPLLRRKAWIIRDRFAHAAGPAAYRKYLDSNPPKTEDGARDALVADLKAVIDATSTCYVFAEAQEAKLAAIKRWGFALVASMGVLTGFVGFLRWGSSDFIFEPVLLLGAVGASVSFLRRIESAAAASAFDTDPARDLALLDRSWWTGATAIALGAVFAMVLYVLFASGSLPDGGPFPRFTWYPPDPAEPAPKYFVSEFASMGSPSSPPDVGKVLVWSFLAGFAERLVPGILDRLSTSTSKKGG